MAAFRLKARNVLNQGALKVEALGRIEILVLLFSSFARPSGVDNELIDDLIKTIKKANIENSISEITVEIKKCEEKNDIEKSKVLLKNFIALQKQMSQL